MCWVTCWAMAEVDVEYICWETCRGICRGECSATRRQSERDSELHCIEKCRDACGTSRRRWGSSIPPLRLRFFNFSSHKIRINCDICRFPSIPHLPGQRKNSSPVSLPSITITLSCRFTFTKFSLPSTPSISQETNPSTADFSFRVEKPR